MERIMDRSKSISLLILLLLGWAIINSPVFAFPFELKSYNWNHLSGPIKTVNLTLNPTCETLTEQEIWTAVTNAVATWNAEVPNFQFELPPGAINQKQSFGWPQNQVNEIFWTHDTPPHPSWTSHCDAFYTGTDLFQ